MFPSKAVLSRCGARVGWPPGPAWIALAGAVLIGVQLAARTFATNDEARFPLPAVRSYPGSPKRASGS